MVLQLPKLNVLPFFFWQYPWHAIPELAEVLDSQNTENGHCLSGENTGRQTPNKDYNEGIRRNPTNATVT